MSTNTGKIEQNSELACQYTWYSDTFAHKIKDIAEDFFDKNFDVHLLGICKNVNSLAGKEAYFVTKVKIDKQHDVFFRLSDDAVKVILDKILGRSSRQFDIDNLSNFETKLLTTFNSFMFRGISEYFKDAQPVLTRQNFDVVFLVFVVVDNESKTSGKLSVALPEVLLNPEKIEANAVFPTDIFEKSIISVRFDVGKTTFTLHELKNLEIGDTVVFETSNAGHLHLKFMDYENEVFLEPNPALMVPYANNGGNNMADENINIWDSIEVEMDAHFDAVDITLGELKKIHAGKVMELASVYQNNVTLTVEDKVIAHGELVVINDKYGVKITEVVVPTIDEQVVQAPAPAATRRVPKAQEEVMQDDADMMDDMGGPAGNQDGTSEDEEFDYSDFDLEEDI
ncbi:FliM/FliN family flagellar motor switch protein [bacterium]|nr:FliM/FliN family flagellar motor switch protein [bacterium]